MKFCQHEVLLDSKESDRKGKRREGEQNATDLRVDAPTVVVVGVDAEAIVTRRGKGKKEGRSAEGYRTVGRARKLVRT